MFIFGDPGNENANVTDLCLRARVEKLHYLCIFRHSGDCRFNSYLKTYY